MRYKCFLAKFLVFALCSHITWAMEVLDDTALADVDGQAGAYIDWELRLNHNVTGANKNKFDTTYCTSVNLQYCRLAISPNNRTAGGNKQWLVFKGIQGTIIFQNVKLEGTDLIYVGGSQVKAALKLTFDPEKPILLRNVGYDALAIETDTANTDAGRGYLNTDKYNTATHGAFDGTHPNISGIGRETGFTGLTMHGNLAVSGSINLFSCGVEHPRC